MPVRGRNAGNKGQGSKWISKTRRRKIYDRDGWKCVWCQRKVCDIPQCPAHPEPATLDHVVARSEGGSNATNNLITCCMRCNRWRGNTTWSSFARWLARYIGSEANGLPAARGLELRRLTAPIRKRIRTILNTDWGF